MKTTHLTLAAAALFGLGLTLAAPAHAETDAPPPHHGKHHGQFFKEADTNNDGALTREEMRAAQEKKLDRMFEKLDSDKDGKLSKEELEKGRKEMHEKFKKFREERAKKAE